MKSFLKNLVLTTALAVLVLWVGYEGARRGVFRGSRENSSVEAIEPKVATELTEPTPTPLPMHFPTVEADEFRPIKHGHLGIDEAFKTCWPNVVSTSTVAGADIFASDLESLFGKIKKREVLENGDASQRLGLLFDNTVFPGGAAGSAIDIDGALTGLQLRAAGRMLHCENAARCECLSTFTP